MVASPRTYRSPELVKYRLTDGVGYDVSPSNANHICNCDCLFPDGWCENIFNSGVQQCCYNHVGNCFQLDGTTKCKDC